jgi:hypothetical protein
LKIPNGQPEALNERLTANIMANKKKDKKTDNGQQPKLPLLIFESLFCCQRSVSYCDGVLVRQSSL